MKTSEHLIRINDISRIYTMDDVKVKALNSVTCHINKGSFVSIRGPSGSGKSTLLHIIGGLDRPDKGTVSIGPYDLSSLNDTQLTLFRKRNIGFVFQFFNLLPTLTALENVLAPRMFDAEVAVGHAEKLLSMVGLTHRKHHTPGQLSGGERQRVAIARALIQNPPILLADEPTGNLDSASGSQILDIFKSINKQRSTTIILATHDRSVSQYGKQQILLKDGRLVSESPGHS